MYMKFQFVGAGLVPARTGRRIHGRARDPPLQVDIYVNLYQ